MLTQEYISLYKSTIGAFILIGDETLQTSTLSAHTNTPVIEAGNHRYPEDIDTIIFGKHFFYLQAQHSLEYLYDPKISKELINNLINNRVDLFTFVQRDFLGFDCKYSFPKDNESVSLLKLNSFDEWWKFQVRKEERNLVRKAEKKGIGVRLVKIDEDFVRGSLRIYNETPIRQGRRYSGYGLSLAAVNEKFSNLKSSDVFGAYYSDELVGLLWLVYGDSVVRIRSFVSLVEHRDKSPNNALMAEGVRRCCEKGFHFMIYEKMGYLPSLDLFKLHNGFRQFIVPRYYVPLSSRGLLAVKFGMQRGIQYSLPPKISRTLLPIYSLASRAIPQSIWGHLSE